MKTKEERNAYARAWRKKRNLEKQGSYIYSVSPNAIQPYKNETMKRVEKYQSRDNTLFDSRPECELHELKCDLRDFLHEKSPFLCNAAGMAKLLVENATEIKIRLTGIQTAEKRVEKSK
jgi:hypothetical protein